MSAFGSTTFERAQELPEEAILSRPVVETPGLQPEDLGALAHLLLLGPVAQPTAKDLAAGMRARGWKMSVDRFEVIAKRLTKAGHLLRESIYNPETKRPEWRYRVYRNPANNPRYLAEGTTALSQVSGEIGENPVPGGVARSETGENPVSPGQSRNRVFPGSAPEPGKTRFPSEGVSAGQSRNPEKPGSASHPPHPPEEVTTSSPYPLTETTGHMPAAPGEEEGVVFDPRETAAAARFLQTLPQPWSIGRVKAKGLAPVLLEVMSDQGWPKLTDLDDRARVLLVQQLTKNPVGVRNHTLVLERDRVPNLPLFDVVAGAGIPAQGSGSGPGPVLAPDPDYKPVPPPADVAAILAGLRKPTI
ncbi:hypothetical protein [Streptomyces hydrogenans]|uniref:hypothetical protein n=1 Tax=Streptomyces hydrogenans TaxID=1873719 RepID=UPI0033DBE284